MPPVSHAFHEAVSRYEVVGGIRSRMRHWGHQAPPRRKHLQMGQPLTILHSVASGDWSECAELDRADREFPAVAWPT